MGDTRTGHGRARVRQRRLGAVSVALVLTLLATLVPAAAADDRIYWTNADGLFDSIGSVNLDGSGSGSDFRPGDVSVFGPGGLVFDTAAGRMYWSNTFDNSIWGAPIDGSGTPTQVNTVGANTSGVGGLAIDVAVGRLYWAAGNGDAISFARLDGSGGGILATGAATLDSPLAVAIDPDGGRIYWTNFAGDTISFAALDGSGGGDLVTAPGPVSGPLGIAVHRGLGRVYWTNTATDSIASATLAGTGARTELDAMDGVPDAPYGMAIDEDAQTLYWAAFVAPSTIARTTLDAGGAATGVQVLTAGDVSPATLTGPYAVAVLRQPVAVARPVVTGLTDNGREPLGLDLRQAERFQRYACGMGTWAADRPGANLYRGPTSFRYQWTRNGTAIPLATEELHRPFESGTYRCRVTAVNEAGQVTQVSAPTEVTITRDPGEVDTTRPRLTVTVKGPRKAAKGKKATFKVRVRSDEACSAKVKAKGRRVKLNPRTRAGEIDDDRRETFRFKGKFAKKRGKARARFTVRCTDAAGNTATETVNKKVRVR